MKRKMVFVVIFIAILPFISGCAEQKPSQVITLYKGSIASGNSIVNFVNHNDPSGAYSEGFCEDMKKLYEKKWRETYYCSSIQFKKFVPDLKWNLSD